MNVRDLGLGRRVQNILVGANGIDTVDALCERTQEDLLRRPHLGAGRVREVEKALAIHGRALKGQTVQPIKQGARHGTHYETVPHSDCQDPERCDCECPGCLRAWAAAGNPQPKPAVELEVRLNPAGAMRVLRRIVVAYDDLGHDALDDDIIAEAKAALGIASGPAAAAEGT